jgi:hypothetical protein
MYQTSHGRLHDAKHNLMADNNQCVAGLLHADHKMHSSHQDIHPKRTDGPASKVADILHAELRMPLKRTSITREQTIKKASTFMLLQPVCSKVEKRLIAEVNVARVPGGETCLYHSTYYERSW